MTLPIGGAKGCVGFGYPGKAGRNLSGTVYTAANKVVRFN